ncbi:MAG: glycosyltransferase family 2 protein [Acidimicrobiales bacterium]|nr:glycosyltransferase family 2 protein [Acidimicrobiales bacterium]
MSIGNENTSDDLALDVTVVCYNSVGDIESALEPIKTMGNLGKIIVIDHGQDGSGQHAKSLGAEVVISEANLGFGSGQNRAFQSVSKPYTLILNPDARVEGNSVEGAISFLENHPKVACCQGVIINSQSGDPERSQGILIKPVHLWGRAFSLKRLLAFSLVRKMASTIKPLSDHVERIPNKPIEVQSLAFVAVLMRTEAFKSVGGFDEGYFLYGEDLDLCKRLALKGWDIVALPGIWATHFGGKSSENSWNREFEWWHGTLRYAQTYWKKSDIYISIIPTLVTGLLLGMKRPSEFIKVVKTLLFETLLVCQSKELQK